MMSCKVKKLAATAALVVCTLGPVSAQEVTEDNMQAPKVAVAAEPVPYDMSKRDPGVLGAMQKGLSKILPSIGKVIKKIAPKACENYWAAAEKADANVQEAMTKNPDANLYVEMLKNAFEPAKIVITEFAIPAYTKAVELVKDGFMAAVKGIFGLFTKK